MHQAFDYLGIRYPVFGLLASFGKTWPVFGLFWEDMSSEAQNNICVCEMYGPHEPKPKMIYNIYEPKTLRIFL